MAQDDSYYILTRDDTSLLTGFIHASADARNFNIIGQHINRTKKKLKKTEDLITRIEDDQRNIGVSSRTYLAMQRKLYAKKSLHISSECIESSDIAIPMERLSPLRFPFNDLSEFFYNLALMN